MNSKTVLYRQIHESWIQGDQVSSQAFRPSKKDNKLLSVYNGDKIDAEGSWKHYTETLQYSSNGVYAVTVKECEDIDLETRPDTEKFEEHSVIDFNKHSGEVIKSKSQLLRNFAKERGWQYIPPA